MGRQIAALGGHVDGEILGLGGGHVAVIGGAGGLAGADLGVIVADGAAQGSSSASTISGSMPVSWRMSSMA